MNPSSLVPHLLRVGAAAVGAGALVVCLGGTAAAHVTIAPSTTTAGGYAVLTVSVPHGCEGSATTGVSIQVPDEITSVTPTRNPLWDVEKETVALEPPVTDAHGNVITERVASVGYRTDEPLPDGFRDTFELAVQLPDVEGATLTFPIIQTCLEGESAWIEVPADGQDAEGLDLPAPSFTVTAAGDDGHDNDVAQTAADERDPAEEAASSTGSALAEAPDGGTSVVGLVALALAFVGVGLGGAAVVRQRRKA